MAMPFCAAGPWVCISSRPAAKSTRLVTATVASWRSWCFRAKAPRGNPTSKPLTKPPRWHMLSTRPKTLLPKPEKPRMKFKMAKLTTLLKMARFSPVEMFRSPNFTPAMAGVKFGDLNISTGEKRAIFSSVVSFAILNFILGFSGFGSSVFGRVDNMCHLGGFVSGLLVGLPLGAFARKHQLLQLATVAVTSLVLFAAGRELIQTHGPAAQKGMAMMEADRGNYQAAAG